MSRYWPIIKLVPIKTNFKFVGFAKYAAVLSVLAVAGSIFMTLFPFSPPCGGLNCGVDFRGGNVLEVSTAPALVDVGQIRETLSAMHLGDVQVQDITFSSAVTAEEDDLTMTVYYHREPRRR